MALITEPNVAAPDAMFQMLVEAHAGLDAADSRRLNARLILLLANHVGDLAVLRDAVAAAGAGLVRGAGAVPGSGEEGGAR